jgi:hypothetical protein
MPEAFACVLVMMICAGIFVWAKLQSMSPANRNRQAEAATLEREIAWLEERLDIAETENWHDDMRSNLEERLSDTRRRHEALKATA